MAESRKDLKQIKSNIEATKIGVKCDISNLKDEIAILEDRLKNKEWTYVYSVMFVEDCAKELKDDGEKLSELTYEYRHKEYWLKHGKEDR